MKKLSFLLNLITYQLFSQQHLIEYELTTKPIPIVEINKNSEYVRYHNSTTMKTLMYFDNEAFHFVVEPEEFQNIDNKKVI